jgi:hypothetical protein
MPSTSRPPLDGFPDLPSAAKPGSLSKVLGRKSPPTTEPLVPKPKPPSERQVAGPLEQEQLEMEPEPGHWMPEFLDLGGLPEQVAPCPRLLDTVAVLLSTFLTINMETAASVAKTTEQETPVKHAQKGCFSKEYNDVLKMNKRYQSGLARPLSGRTALAAASKPLSDRMAKSWPGQPKIGMLGGAPSKDDDESTSESEPHVNVKSAPAKDDEEDTSDSDLYVNVESEDIEILKTDRTVCHVCGVGKLLKNANRNKGIVILGRNGIRRAIHLDYRCQNRNKYKPCRAGHYYGYSTVNGLIVYDDDALKKKTLICSTQTAVDIDYLFELTCDIEINNVTFEGAAKKFNRFHSSHLPSDVLNRRELAFRKRVAEAYYLYSYLHVCQTLEIPDYQIIRSSVDTEILDKKILLTNAWRKKWASDHKCAVKGCPWMIIIDGGLKPWRRVCGAKMSGIRHFKETGYTHITGCTVQPLPASKFCSLHQNEESPALDHSKISESSKMKLRDRRKAISYSEKSVQDTLYVIESLVEKSENQFKVKWVGYDIETWEPAENIPKFIKNYYEDAAKLGTPLPNPKIKYTKKLASGALMHFLTWEGVTKTGDGSWVGEDWFKLASEDGDIVSTAAEESVTCNTRKSRDKQAKTLHSVGLLIGALPCGTVVLWDELHGSEGIRQVHGMMAEHISNLGEHNQITHMGYDDACHFSLHARRPDVMAKSEASTKLGEIPIVVDKFHFKNHIGKWCIENCDPYKLPELVQVNTPVCEQLFKRINKHTNCKGMSESRYFLFWLMNLNIHNMDVDGTANNLGDPRSEHYWNSFKILPVDFTNLPEKHKDAEVIALVAQGKENETVNEEIALGQEGEVKSGLDAEDQTASLESMFSKVSLSAISPFTCDQCGAGFDTEGRMKSHMKKHHQINVIRFKCLECDKPLSTKQALERHILSVHRICKHCRVEYKTENERNVCAATHTTCSKCDTDMTTPSQLKRHKC